MKYAVPFAVGKTYVENYFDYRSKQKVSLVIYNYFKFKKNDLIYSQLDIRYLVCSTRLPMSFYSC